MCQEEFATKQSHILRYSVRDTRLSSVEVVFYLFANEMFAISLYNGGTFSVNNGNNCCHCRLLLGHLPLRLSFAEVLFYLGHH